MQLPEDPSQRGESPRARLGFASLPCWMGPWEAGSGRLYLLFSLFLL